MAAENSKCTEVDNQMKYIHLKFQNNYVFMLLSQKKYDDID